VRSFECKFIIRIFVFKARVMVTKLTLTVDEFVVKRAKSFARKTGRSLSGLVENYLETLTEEDGGKGNLSPKLKKIVGVVKLPKDFDEKKELDNYLAKKHG
jgi:Mrp family chromosome partitioning ATPase